VIDEEEIDEQSCDQDIAVFPPLDAPDTSDHFGEGCSSAHSRKLFLGWRFCCIIQGGACRGCRGML
jgi:hypothetical protein